MRLAVIISAMVLLLCVLLGVARADAPPLDTAADAIELGQYSAARGALLPYVTNQDMVDGPGSNDAKAWYMLAVADLGAADYGDGLAAALHAQRLDPALRFAVPAQFDAVLGELTAGAARTPAPYVSPIPASWQVKAGLVAMVLMMTALCGGYLYPKFKGASYAE